LVTGAAFDVAVVGGGAAGCVVAARLADSGRRLVVLLEAGPDLRGRVPEDIRDGWHMTPEFDWGYTSEPNRLGATQKLRRGRLIGGTSSITRFALRGSPADFEEWRALGNDDWGFEDVLPYLRRLETDLEFGAEAWHGDGGPIPVGRYPDLERTEIHAAVIDAIEATGFPPVEDHNRPGAVGVGPMPMNSRGAVRVTTADAYLPFGRTPPNLTIRPDSAVSELTFDGPRVTGARLVDGTRIGASCVVLCAGTYGSPLILMRSGIGPAEDLRSVGIRPQVNLSGVGANLADHPQTSLDSGYRGPARTAPILHTAATFHSRIASADGPPDLMLWVADPGPPDSPPQLEVEVLLLKPRARGRVRLRSAEPTDPPRIDLPDSTEEADVERLAEGYRAAREVVSRRSLRRLCGDALPPDLDADELYRLIRENWYSIPHVVGTCAMGPSPDDGAVVDDSGRVHASIMPTVPSGFTHIPTIMIAERLSERIAALP
jgi:choline dehydrogenase